MQQKIYLDVLVTINGLMTYFLLLGCAKITGRARAVKRMLISALLGGISALIIFVPLHNPWISFGYKLAIAIALVRVAFAYTGWRQFWRDLLVFFALSFFFGGVVFGLLSLMAPYYMLYHNGVVYFHIPSLVLIITFGICYFLIVQFSKVFSARLAVQERYILHVVLQGNSVSLRAMVDTGNRLVEHFSGDPVILCYAKALQPILSKPLWQAVENWQHTQDTGALQQLESLPGLRMIPYHALGKTGLLPAFRPDSATVTTGGRTFVLQPSYLAIAQQDFLHGQCQALLPGQMILSSERKRVPIC